MNNPISTPTPPQALKDGLRSLAASAEATTQAHVIAPAFDAARRMGSITSEVIDKTRDHLAEKVTDVEEFASQQYDRTAKWVSANPFSALGIGFVVGMFITHAVGRSAKH